MLDYLLGVLVWLSVLGNVFVGFLVYLRNRKSKVNIAFSLLTFSGVIWAIGLFFYQHPIYFHPEIWLRFVYLAVLLLLGLFFNFSFVFPLQEGKLWSFPVVIYGFSALVFAYTIVFTRLFLYSVTVTPWGYEQILGPIYPFFGIWSTFFTFWMLVNLFKNYSQKQVN